MNKKLNLGGQPQPIAIVVEGQRDAAILRQLVDQESGVVPRFFAAQGKMSVTSLARNILVHEPSKVLVVLDADGVEPSKLRREHADALESVAPSTRYRVFAFSSSLDDIVEHIVGPTVQVINEENLRKLRGHEEVQQFINAVQQLQPCELDAASP